MTTYVTVIGPADLTERVLEIAALNEKQFGNLTLLSCPYENESETLELITRYRSQTDFFLFTGPIPYYLVKEQLGAELQGSYVSVSVISLLLALYEHKEDFKGPQKKLRFSIDFIQKSALDALLEDMNLSDSEVYVKEYGPGVTAKELVEFHTELQKSQRTDFAVTYLASAYEALLEGGYTAYRTKITNTAIREALSRLSLEAENTLPREIQICSGIVKLQSDPNDSQSIYENRRLFLAVIDIFISFCESLNASFRIDNQNELTFITTREVMEKVSGGHRCMPLLSQIERLSPLKLVMGVGYGYFPSEADKSARTALKHAMAHSKSGCCYMMDDGQLISVSGGQETYSFYDSFCDPSWIELAKRCGVSPMTLSKIAGIAARKKTEAFSANEVAECLHITARSARRILKSLQDGGVAAAVGEQNGDRGRPRQLFKMTVQSR